MQQRFTERVEKVVKLANVIAREFEQDYVGTEHILLAIHREGTGMGARILIERGITAERLKAEIEKLMRKSLEDTWVFGRLPGTPHFRNVVATALDEAQKMNSDQLHTEHLVLALLREEGSVAYHALKNLGCDLESVRADILASLSNDDATRTG
jgi:ATP-dependent Clp protease ATP-binding subunit ClpC